MSVPALEVADVAKNYGSLSVIRSVSLAVAPGEARNAEYARTLGRVLRRPALIPVPPFGPQLLLGAEGARELAAASQRVRPAALAAAGHPFRYPHLEGGLRHVLGRDSSSAGPQPAPIWDTAASE